MPLKPKTRPVGQHVILTTDYELEGKVFPAGTRTVVEDCRVGSDYKVLYQITLPNKMGSRIAYWVGAAVIKTLK